MPAPTTGGSTAVVPVASRRSTPLTGRAAVLALVVVVLGLSFAYPLRGWFDQRAQIAELAERTTAQERRIAELQSNLERWDDPSYVETVARERLRFVMPGEASFVVLGGDEPSDLSAGPVDGEADGEWWDRLWSTVQEADRLPADVAAAGEAGTADAGAEDVAPDGGAAVPDGGAAVPDGEATPDIPGAATPAPSAGASAAPATD